MWSEKFNWHFDYARLVLDAGFCFNKLKQDYAIDKSKLALLDVDSIVKEKDVSTLERYIPVVVHFKLENEQSQVLDANFVKVFRICQLAIEYLIFCKMYLDNTVVLLKKELSKCMQENKELKTTVNELTAENNYLKKEIKVLENIPPTIPVETFKCEHCSKLFATEEFLLAHFKRRHEISPLQEQTNKLQSEIKELKERLNSTEKFTLPEKETVQEPQNLDNHKEVSELQQKVEMLRIHVESELRLLQTQKNFQEKYEKWFEQVLSTMKGVKPDNTETNYAKDEVTLQRRNSATQTDKKNIDTKEVAISACDEGRSRDLMGQTDLEEVRRKLSSENQEHFVKVENAIEEMVANSLGKMETEVHTLLSKIKIPELTNTVQSTNIEKGSSNTVVRYIKEPPVARKRSKVIIEKKQASSNTEASPTKGLHFFEPPKILTKTKAKLPITNSREVKVTTVDNGTTMESASSSSDSEEESETSISEESTPEKISAKLKPAQVDVKSSNTSTLGRHSISSIKKVAESETVLRDLQQEVEQIVHNRLRELGVSPNWKGLPDRSYQQAMTIINHQASLTKKSFPHYNSLRRRISREIEKQTNNPRQRKYSSESNCSQIPKTHTLGAKKEKISKIQEHTTEIVVHKPLLTMHNDKTIDSNSESSEIPLKTNNIATIITTAHISEKKPRNLPDDVDAAYSTVVKELKNVSKRQESETEESASEIIKKIEMQRTKSALKSQNFATLTRKKVLFDLQGSGEQEKPKIVDGGSTTSVASSVFDAPKDKVSKDRKENIEVSDISDWDISEILN